LAWLGRSLTSFAKVGTYVNLLNGAPTLVEANNLVRPS